MNRERFRHGFCFGYTTPQYNKHARPLFATINYVDRDKYFLVNDGYYHLLTIKGHGFKHEREVRLIAKSPALVWATADHANPTLEEITALAESAGKGFNVSIDMKRLITEIRVHAPAKSDYLDPVREEVQKKRMLPEIVKPSVASSVRKSEFLHMTISVRNRIPPFSAERLEAISKVLGETNEGLTGSEIDHLLRNCNIPNPTPDMTKWKRLHNAFVEFQNEHQVGNHVVVFIKRAMDPARYVGEPTVFRSRRDSLNSVLAFCGYTLGEDAQLRRADAARTIDQALERANRLHAALVQRSVHDDVLTFCKAELLEEDYFHAVFEAMKSITAKIRTLTGMTGDGCDLVHNAFGQKFGDPLLAINPFKTETHKGEQYGFMNLLKGLYGTIRNPLAHDPKIEWPMTEQDALDILTMISLVHRKLDQAYRLR